MKRPPYRTSESIFARGMARDVVWVGLLMGVISLVLGYLEWVQDLPYWQTTVFTTLTLAQMGNVLATRSERYSLFKIGVLYFDSRVRNSNADTFSLCHGPGRPGSHIPAGVDAVLIPTIQMPTPGPIFIIGQMRKGGS